MACRTCGRALDEGARFCPDCSSVSGGQCRSCGLSPDADARFCKRCGTRVKGDRAALAEDDARERKVATLLFADLAGFTALTEVRDPEIVSTYVAETFERCAEDARRYGGTIEKFAGDAMLVVFGVPAAHEDDPERAVRAALDMQAVMAQRGGDEPDRPDLRLRIGIETGEVLVDQARASAERDRFVTGDAVNTAARLEATAAPGTVVVGPAAHGLTRNTIDYEELPALALKGKAVPVTAWRALAVRTSRGGERAPLGLEAPLVGRDAELGRLQEAVRATVETGRPHLVTVIGAAGVGKSRLARELELSLAEMPGHYRWLKGRCLAYADSSYGALAEVVRADAGIVDGDPDAAEERLWKRLVELAIADGTAEVRQALEATLGFGGRQSVRRDRIVTGWERYLGAIAREAPLVLVIEDIHWADDDLLSLLTCQARWSEGPMLILCLARHELLERYPTWASGLPEATTITLEALTAGDSVTLLDGLLQGELPAALRDRIVRQTEGNPLFVEETVRMLIDDGVLQRADGSWRVARPVEEIEAPRSVEAVIAARLDSLPREEKRLAQEAAVIGRIFWDRLVAHLAAEDVARTSGRIAGLRAKELIVPRLTSSLAGAVEYSFRHVLIRDVAYDSLPKRDRARLHKQIALWAEDQLADRIEGSSDLVASHLAAALTYEEELASGGGATLRQTRELTYRAALRAARRASSVGLLTRACHWMRKAIDLADALELGAREIASLADEDASWHGTMSWYPDHAELLTRAVEALEAQPGLPDGDEQLLARVRCALGEALRGVPDFEKAQAVLKKGIDRLGSGGPTPGRARLYRTLGWVLLFADHADEAAPLLERAIAEARACSDERTLRWALVDLAMNQTQLDGDIDTALGASEEGYRLAAEVDDRAFILRCCNNMGAFHAARGDAPELARERLLEGLRLARRETEGGSNMGLALNLAVTEADMGRLDDALVHIDEGISAAAATGEPNGTLFTDRALIHRLRGDTEAAQEDETKVGRELPAEPQLVPAHLIGQAIADWSRDPATALGELAVHFERVDRVGDYWGDVPRLVARMALRLGDHELVRRAVAQNQRVRVSGARALQASHRSVDGLISDDGGRAVEEAAATLEECGYIWRALEAWTDAAMLAARAGRSSEAQGRALAITERYGMHPLLGPLPETARPDSYTPRPGRGDPASTPPAPRSGIRSADTSSRGAGGPWSR